MQNYKRILVPYTGMRRNGMSISENMWHYLCENMMDAFASVDMSGRIQMCNDLFCKLLGYEREELLSMTYFELTPEKWYGSECDVIKNQVMTKGFSEIYEKEYRRKDGTIFPVELRTCLYRNGNGDPEAMWAIVRDITDRKRAEDERLELERKLLRVQKMESLGVIAGGIAHDFNTLLSVIIGNLELGLLKLPTDSPVRGNLEQAMLASERSADLTRQMLAYCGKGLFVSKEIDLNDFVCRNENLFRASVSSRKPPSHSCICLNGVRIQVVQSGEDTNRVSRANDYVQKTTVFWAPTALLHDCYKIVVLLIQ
jgi:PAS domain S-box-containing protein